MAWIESHQSLGTHLKLRRLARELRIHRAQAIGHLHFLWWWALDNAPGGDVSALTSAEIAEVAEWPGSEDVFLAALKSCGWVDPDGMIHDWPEYAGRLIAQRARDRERKRAKPPAEFRRNSGGIPADGGRTADVPNPTQPNPTNPLTPLSPSVEFPVEPPPGFPRTLEEAQVHSDFVGCTKEFAAQEWHKAVSRGGRDSKDIPIRNWRGYLASAVAYSRARNGSSAVLTPPDSETAAERRQRILREAL